MNQPQEFQIPQPLEPPEPTQAAVTQPNPVAPTAVDPAVQLVRQQLANLYDQPVPASRAEPAIQPPSWYQSSPAPAPRPVPMPVLGPEPVIGSVEAPKRSLDGVKAQLLSNVRGAGNKRLSRLKPLIIATITGMLFLSVSYNEVALAQIRQYVSPGSSLTTPVIVDPSLEQKISQEPRIIIPKINVDVPVVYDIKTFDETAIQDGLERGVVHYGTTALPGQKGNNVIVGHSSNNFFNSGKYKFAFVLLNRLEVGDTFMLNYRGERFIYKIFSKKIIEPDDFSLIQPTAIPTTTLITCTPPGTNWHRLVVQAEQISPDPDAAKKSTAAIPTKIDTPVPGNAPSFWQNIFNLFD